MMNTNYEDQGILNASGLGCRLPELGKFLFLSRRLFLLLFGKKE